MVNAVLLMSAASTLVVATAYGLVARRLWSKRSSDARSDRALRSFAAWWGLTSANQVLGSALYAAAALGFVHLETQTSYVVVQRLLLAGSLAGLMHYVVYLLTGRELLVTIGAFYASFFAFSLWTVFATAPDSVAVYRWRTDLTGTVALPPVVQLLHGLWIILPPVVACLSLLFVARRVEAPSARLRLRAIAIGVAVWWVVAVLAGQKAALDNDAFQIVNRAVGIVVALVILATFEPTPWLRRTLGIQPYAL